MHLLLNRTFQFLMFVTLICIHSVSCTEGSSHYSYFKSKQFEWERNTELTSRQQKLSQSIDTFFKNKVRQTGFNGCVLVSQEGQIIYKNCFGFADYEEKEKFNDSSAFQLASVSKPFTATAIMILNEEGNLKLDDAVSKYIDDFPYDEITIQMLLSHRSGLQNYVFAFDSMKLPADSFVTNKDVANYFIFSKPTLQSTPGKHFAYCNSNYALLALIIEKASGKSYAEFLMDKIFIPSHMKYTFVSDAFDEEKFSNHVSDYEGSKWRQVPKLFADGVVGDKGVYSTCYDLYLFDQALNHGVLLSNESLEEMYKGYSYEKPGIRNYGLGWRLKEFKNGEKLIYHNGWWRGYNTLFCRRPDQNTSIIVLSNKFNKSAYNVTAVFDLLHMEDGVSDEEAP